MLGGHSTLDPPLPIPNRTVKRRRADDSAQLVCESRSPPGSPKKSPPALPREGFFTSATTSGTLPRGKSQRVSITTNVHCVIWFGCTSNCCASSTIVFSPRTAARATFALKAGVWFRRGRFAMVSPVAAIMPPSGRNSTYPTCPVFPSQLSARKSLT